MPRRERGSTAAGFREQLLARLRNRAATDGVSVRRLQQRVAFERFLARLAGSGEWMLKGGFALELRYGLGNRPTQDVDLRSESPPAEALARLRTTVAMAHIEDHFSFELGAVAQELQGAPGGGLRVRVTPRLAGVPLVPLSIDLASGDPVVGDVEEMEGSDLLSFAGIAPVRFPIYPVAQHLAEKLHAYTLPRGEDNTRVKDLVDMATIAALEVVGGDRLLGRVRATFAARKTHDPPATLPDPPPAWRAPYRALVVESAIAPSLELADGHAVAAALWNPVLDGSAIGRAWDAGTRSWQPSAIR